MSDLGKLPETVAEAADEQDGAAQLLDSEASGSAPQGYEGLR